MAHFTVYGIDYPRVTMPEFRFSEWALVRAATRLGSQEFVLAHGLDDDAPVDQLVMYGYAAVAFWRGNPSMSIDRVVVALETCTDEDITFTPDAADLETDAVPLDVPADGSSLTEASSTTSNGSNNTPDSSSEPTSPNAGGQAGSLTGSPA